VVFDLPVANEVKRKLMGLNALRLMPKVRVPEKYRRSANGHRPSIPTPTDG
jgi:hypothetical protein